MPANAIYRCNPVFIIAYAGSSIDACRKDSGGTLKKLIVVFLLVMGLTVPASAYDYTLPEAPEQAADLLPTDRDTFSEGLWYVITSAFAVLHPQLMESGKVALYVIGATMLIGILKSREGTGKEAVSLVGVVAIACMLLQPAGVQIAAATQTVAQLSEYGKLLLPLMTAALAAQGGTATSAALYTATVTFDAVLSAVIRGILVPMVYIYLVLAVVHGAIGDEMMKRLRGLMKSIMTWTLKTILYVFTAYIGITGVVSGTADQSAVKAAKLTISGMVPVVGSILSDASEAVLVGASVVKNTAGISGILVVIAIAIVPFLQIGLQYLGLKLTAAVCDLFSDKQITGLIEDFSGAMGFLLGMTGAACMIFLISLVCFLKGMG